MHYHMQHGQYRQVIAVCERHGEQDPSLWEQALSYFARKEEDCKEYVAAVLKHIENKNLMPPLLGTWEERLAEGGSVQWALRGSLSHVFLASHLSGTDPGPQLHSYPVHHPRLPGPKTAETEPADCTGRASGEAVQGGDYSHPPGNPRAQVKVAVIGYVEWTGDDFVCHNVMLCAFQTEDL